MIKNSSTIDIEFSMRVFFSMYFFFNLSFLSLSYLSMLPYIFRRMKSYKFFFFITEELGSKNRSTYLPIFSQFIPIHCVNLATYMHA